MSDQVPEDAVTTARLSIPFTFLTTILDPGLKWCSGLVGWHIPSDDRARVGLTAISGQEANWTERLQKPIPYAHGLYQFERLGGVRGVLYDDVTRPMALAACVKAGVPAPVTTLGAWRMLATDDALATAFARLLLYTDVLPNPAMDDEEGWYRYYLNLWRPGSPSRARWSGVFPQALDAVRATSK